MDVSSATNNMRNNRVRKCCLLRCTNDHPKQTCLLIVCHDLCKNVLPLYHYFVYYRKNTDMHHPKHHRLQQNHHTNRILTTCNQVGPRINQLRKGTQVCNLYGDRFVTFIIMLHFVFCGFSFHLSVSFLFVVAVFFIFLLLL